MVLHKSRQIALRGDATRHTTLCGRMNKRCEDGMNIAANEAEVTCKFCLARLKRLAA